jgi:hypothetical protein
MHGCPNSKIARGARERRANPPRMGTAGDLWRRLSDCCRCSGDAPGHHRPTIAVLAVCRCAGWLPGLSPDNHGKGASMSRASASRTPDERPVERRSNAGRAPVGDSRREFALSAGGVPPRVIAKSLTDWCLNRRGAIQARTSGLGRLASCADTVDLRAEVAPPGGAAGRIGTLQRPWRTAGEDSAGRSVPNHASEVTSPCGAPHGPDLARLSGRRRIPGGLGRDRPSPAGYRVGWATAAVDRIRRRTGSC